WTPRYLGVHSDRRSTRYRHEWRQIHLDNGMEMSVWLHVDRHRANRWIPFCGVTAATSDLRVLATTDFAIERLSFVRDPGHVRPPAGAHGPNSSRGRLAATCCRFSPISRLRSTNKRLTEAINLKWRRAPRPSGARSAPPWEGTGRDARLHFSFREGSIACPAR